MVNRMRATRAHRDNRRSHHALDGVRLSTDGKTGGIHLRHRVDMTTGTYRGRKVIDMAKVTAKAVAKSAKSAKKDGAAK